MNRGKLQTLVMVTVFLLLLGVGGLLLYNNYIKETPTTTTPKVTMNMSRPDIERGVVYRPGATDAPLTLVEVFSYGCPHCKDFQEVMEPLIKKYVDTGKVKLGVSSITNPTTLVMDLAGKILSRSDVPGYFKFNQLALQNQDKLMNGEVLNEISRLETAKDPALLEKKLEYAKQQVADTLEIVGQVTNATVAQEVKEDLSAYLGYMKAQSEGKVEQADKEKYAKIDNLVKEVVGTQKGLIEEGVKGSPELIHVKEEQGGKKGEKLEFNSEMTLENVMQQIEARLDRIEGALDKK